MDGENVLDYTMEFDLAIKKNEIRSFVEKGTGNYYKADPDRYSMFALICGI